VLRALPVPSGAKAPGAVPFEDEASALVAGTAAATPGAANSLYPSAYLTQMVKTHAKLAAVRCKVP
jgi:hypothetical protein